MLNNLLKEASKLWHDRSPSEQPGHGSPVYDFYTKKLQRHIEGLTRRFGYQELIVKASVGIGRWAQIPWIGIRNSKVTTNFKEGLFVVYVFSPEFGAVYLTLIQGVSDLSLNELEKSTSEHRKRIRKPEGFSVGLEGKLAHDEPLNSKPDKYKKGILYSRKYDLQNLLHDEELEKDLKNALEAYKDYT